MRIKWEITIGQIVITVLTLLTAGAFFWKAFADVRVLQTESATLKAESDKHASKEVVELMKDDLSFMRQDVRDIKLAVLNYLAKENAAKPSKKVAHPKGNDRGIID